MRFMIAFLIPFCINLFPKGALGADKEDVQKVIRLITNPNVEGLLSRRVDMLSGGEVQVVFRNRGKRYTLYYTGPSENGVVWLSVWVRPDGTSDSEVLLTFTDHHLTGVVDFGINGKRGSARTTQLFHSGLAEGRPLQGAQFRKYWQRQYDSAIKAALRQLRVRL